MGGVFVSLTENNKKTFHKSFLESFLFQLVFGMVFFFPFYNFFFYILKKTNVIKFFHAILGQEKKQKNQHLLFKFPSFIISATNCRQPSSVSSTSYIMLWIVGCWSGIGTAIRTWTPSIRIRTASATSSGRRGSRTHLGIKSILLVCLSLALKIH